MGSVVCGILLGSTPDCTVLAATLPARPIGPSSLLRAVSGAVLLTAAVPARAIAPSALIDAASSPDCAMFSGALGAVLSVRSSAPSMMFAPVSSPERAVFGGALMLPVRAIVPSPLAALPAAAAAAAELVAPPSVLTAPTAAAGGGGAMDVREVSPPGSDVRSGRHRLSLRYTCAASAAAAEVKEDPD
jgi:hypothetical protein